MTTVGFGRTAGARVARFTLQKRRRAAAVQIDSGVGDAVSEEVEAGKFFDADDACADEDGGLAGVIGDGDFDGRICFVTMAAAKTEAAFGNVVAFDDVFTGWIEPDAGDEVDASADVATQIEFAAGGKFGLRSGVRRGWRFFDGDGGGYGSQQ